MGKEQRSILQGSIGAKNLEIDAVQAEIVEKQKSMDSVRATEDKSRSNLTSLKNERNDLSKQIGEVMDERNASRNEFRDANNKWYDYQRAVKARKNILYEEGKLKYDEEKKSVPQGN